MPNSATIRDRRPHDPDWSAPPLGYRDALALVTADLAKATAAAERDERRGDRAGRARRSMLLDSRGLALI